MQLIRQSRFQRQKFWQRIKDFIVWFHRIFSITLFSKLNNEASYLKTYLWSINSHSMPIYTVILHRKLPSDKLISKILSRINYIINSKKQNVSFFKVYIPLGDGVI